MTHRVAYIPSLLLAVCVLLSAGCQTSPAAHHAAPTAAQRAQWANTKGGISRCVETERRLEAVCSDLLQDRAEPVGVEVRILKTTRPGAFAFPPNRVYVTQGALAEWPEAELAAAVAHELGHLIDDGYLAPPYTLTPNDDHQTHHASDHRLRIEMRADEIGLSLLESSGHETASMGSLLTRLAADARLSDATRTHLAARARSLETTTR